MTIRSLIGESKLKQLDAELLIGHILGKPRSWIIAHDDETLSEIQLSQWRILRDRRYGDEPVAYIIGEKEFFGRTFAVTPDVLIPRPATEGLVETALDFLRHPRSITVPLDRGICAVARPLHSGDWGELIDAGTGSGCIAITLALEKPETSIHAVDLSEKALKIAKRNAVRLHADTRIQFTRGDAAVFVTKHERPFVLVSNPPYIPAGTALPTSVEAFEPQAALFSGKDGMQLISPLLTAAVANVHCKGIVMEMRSDQLEEADRILGTKSGVVS